MRHASPEERVVLSEWALEMSAILQTVRFGELPEAAKYTEELQLAVALVAAGHGREHVRVGPAVRPASAFVERFGLEHLVERRRRASWN